MRRRCTGGAASTIGDEVDLSLAKSFSSFISLCLQEDDIEDEHCLQWEHPSMLCVGWGFQSWKFSLLIPRKQWPQCSKNAIACMALSTTSRLSRKSYKEQVGALFILPIFKYPLVLSLFCPYSNTHWCSLYSTHSNTHWPTAPFCGRISVRSILHSTCVSLVGGRMAISQGKPSYEGCRRFCAKKNRCWLFWKMCPALCASQDQALGPLQQCWKWNPESSYPVFFIRRFLDAA